MKTMMALAVALGTGLAVLVARSLRARAKRKHEPVEYYLGWGGYSHPIALQKMITKGEADAVAARGGAYVIGYFDADGRLTRAIKMLRGAVFFDFEYAYHPNGRRKTARVTNAEGVVSVREYDKAGRGRADNPLFW
jgi:Family of unknown function (DUF6156)